MVVVVAVDVLLVYGASASFLLVLILVLVQCTITMYNNCNPYYYFDDEAFILILESEFWHDTY
jgi:hypothetical protein